jgi:hypothetical protein
MGIAADETLEAYHRAWDYQPGSDLTVSVQIMYEGALKALGLEVDLPPGWTFVSADGTDAPPVVPLGGESGTIAFAWLTPPASPVEFTYTVHVPAGATEIEQIASRVRYRRLQGEIIEPVLPNPLIAGGCLGDFDKDGDVDGLDLAPVANRIIGILIALFAPEFGRVGCPIN